MTRKSSIHFKPVSNVRFAVSHSERTDLSEPAYLLPKEHQLANILIPESLSENDLAALFIQQKSGMSRQAKTAGSSPFWEGVVVLPNTNGPEQTTNLKGWKKEYEAATGHKVLHMAIHLDEGYIDTAGVPQYNPHAHVIVSRMDAQNRVIHLDRSKLAGVQDLTAKTLQMERGSTLEDRKGHRGRTHIEHREFRKLADEKRVQLDAQKAETARMHRLSKEWSDADLDKIKDLKTKLDEVQTEAKKVPDLVAQLEGEPARLEAALAAQGEKYMLDRATMKQENADALAAGLAKMHSQKDYQDLKTTHLGEIETLTKAHADDVAMLKAKHAEALADLKTELARAAQQAAKVPSLEAKATGLQAQIAQLTPLAEQVPDLKTKLDGEPERLRLALVAEAAAAGLDKPISQKDYSDLKKAYEAALAEAAKVPALAEQVKTLKPQADKVQGLEKDLTTARAEAGKVPDLVATVTLKTAEINRLTPVAGKVPGLEKDLTTAQAQITQQAAAFESLKVEAMAVITPLRTEVKTMTTKITELEAAKLEADKTRFADMAKAYQDGKEAGTPAHLIAPSQEAANPPSPSTRGGATSLPTSGARIQNMRERLQEASKQATEAPKAPSHPIAPPSPEKSLQEALKASWDAFVDWIKGVGAHVPINTARSDHYGPVVQRDDLHAVQRVGGGKFAIHQLDRLDKVPDLDNPKMEIKYRDGIGHVGGNGLEQNPRPRMR